MLSFLFLILMLVTMFKMTGFILGLGFKVVGLIISLIGYIIVGALAIAMIGMATFVVPFVLFGAIGSIVYYMFR